MQKVILSLQLQYFTSNESLIQRIWGIRLGQFTKTERGRPKYPTSINLWQGCYSGNCSKFFNSTFHLVSKIMQSHTLKQSKRGWQVGSHHICIEISIKYNTSRQVVRKQGATTCWYGAWGIGASIQYRTTSGNSSQISQIRWTGIPTQTESNLKSYCNFTGTHFKTYSKVTSAQLCKLSCGVSYRLAHQMK